MLSSTPDYFVLEFLNQAHIFVMMFFCYVNVIHEAVNFERKFSNLIILTLWLPS